MPRRPRRGVDLRDREAVAGHAERIRGRTCLGTPTAFATLFALVETFPDRPRRRLGRSGVAAGPAFAALAGWRLADHLHMRRADEYGGADTPPDAYRRAARRYRALAAVYAAVTTGAAYSILRWRGLP